MKKTFLSIMLLSPMLVIAQQSNKFLQPNFFSKTTSLSEVKQAVASGSSPTESNERAFDAAALAILADAPMEVIQYLIEQPENGVSKRTHGQRTYLHWAASKGNLPLVNYLISKGADVNALTDVDATPLYQAATSGVTNPKLYEVFFKEGVDPLTTYDDGANILMLAISNDKDLSLLKYLQTKGLSISDVDKNGATVADYVARGGNVSILKKLIEQGAKTTNNALLFAAQGARRHVNGLGIYQYLADTLKLDPSVRDANGNTLIQIVASKPNQREVVQYLIEKGLDVNNLNKKGQNALMEVAGTSDTELLQSILALTSNPSQIDENGYSALTRAIRTGLTDNVKVLINSGLDARIKDKEGYNLAYHLVDAYRPPRGGRGVTSLGADPLEEKLQLIKQKGVDVVSPQPDGNTLIHIAVAKSNIDLVKKLSHLGINLNTLNDDGLTPLHRAALIARTNDMLKLLISLGADKSVLTDMDETAYDIAEENSYLTDNNIDISFLK